METCGRDRARRSVGPVAPAGNGFASNLNRGQAKDEIENPSKTTIKVNHTIELEFIRVVFFTSVCLFVGFSKADIITQSTNDPVDIFKKAISSQVNVDHIVAGEALVDKEIIAGAAKDSIYLDSKIHWYEGACSGSNFFMRRISDPIDTNNVPGDPGLAGQFTGKTYQYNKTALTYTTETTNPVADFSHSQRTILNEFLNMGLAYLAPASVIWNGNVVQATRDDGTKMTGLLEISNGLPATLKINFSDGKTPSQIINYYYPDLVGSLDGYPAKMIVSRLSKDVLLPSMEFSIHDLQLSARCLPECIFDPSNYLSSGIRFTNVSSNGYYFSLGPHGNGKPVRQEARPRTLNTTRSFWSRGMVVVFFGITTLAFVMLWIKYGKPNGIITNKD